MNNKITINLDYEDGKRLFKLLGILYDFLELTESIVEWRTVKDDVEKTMDTLWKVLNEIDNCTGVDDG